MSFPFLLSWYVRRPFYTMTNPDDPSTSNSYDLFIRWCLVFSWVPYNEYVTESFFNVMKLQRTRNLFRRTEVPRPGKYGCSSFRWLFDLVGDNCDWMTLQGLLQKKIADKGLDPSSLQFYLDAFKHGISPHGGGGIGDKNIFTFFHL